MLITKGHPRKKALFTIGKMRLHPIDLGRPQWIHGGDFSKKLCDASHRPNLRPLDSRLFQSLGHHVKPDEILIGLPPDD